MLIVYIAIIVILPIIAQVIRIVVEKNIISQGYIPAIPHVLYLTNIKNRGVAFGWFQNGTLFFAITTSIIIVVMTILLFKNYKKSKLFSFAAVLIIGGGLGNLFERLFLGYVVDYLSLTFFSPICNFADYCITAGTVCLIIYLLFYSDILNDSKKKKVKATASAADAAEKPAEKSDDSAEDEQA